MSATLAWIQQAAESLADAMPHQAGKQSRSTNWRAGTMEEFRQKTLEAALKKVTEEREREDSGAAPGPSVAPRLNFAETLKRESRTAPQPRTGPAADSEPTQQENEAAVVHYLKTSTKFRFSCMTRKALRDILLEQIRRGELPLWPRSRPSCKETLSPGQNDGDSRIKFRREFREISQSYFNAILHLVRSSISFYKNPTFTKCNTCVTLRNMARMKTNSRQQKTDIERARTFHNHFVLSEVSSAWAKELSSCCKITRLTQR
jgi:hypothetical protein